jgi:hypothetical protein
LQPFFVLNGLQRLWRRRFLLYPFSQFRGSARRGALSRAGEFEGFSPQILLLPF